MKPTVDVSEYTGIFTSHDKPPQGFGNWIFELRHRDGTAETVEIRANWGDAKRQIIDLVTRNYPEGHYPQIIALP